MEEKIFIGTVKSNIDLKQEHYIHDIRGEKLYLYKHCFSKHFWCFGNLHDYYP